MIYAVAIQGCPKGEGTKFKVNRNGVWPVILKSINGVQLPEKSDIMDGSIAESLGIVIGSTYTLMINRREDYISNGKAYLNYDYVPVGGNVTQHIGAEIAREAIGDIARLIARPAAPANPTPTPVLTQPPIINADTETEDEDEELTEEQMQAEIERLKAELKAKKAADKKAAASKEAAPEATPF
jgi:hypothetical protein